MARAKARGAKAVTGGQRPSLEGLGKGHFYEPHCVDRGLSGSVLSSLDDVG